MNPCPQKYLGGRRDPVELGGARRPERAGPLAIFTASAALFAMVSLSSCAGLTSAGKRVAAGSLTGSATTLSFGNLSVGSNATQTLTFTSTGTGIVNIASASISGTGFAAVGGSP